MSDETAGLYDFAFKPAISMGVVHVHVCFTITSEWPARSPTSIICWASGFRHFPVPEIFV
jgi:hypothetical protein